MLADLRYGCRSLRRSPGFTAANVLTLEPGLVVMHAEATESIANVRAAGVEVIEVPYSEFMKEGGGLHCSTGQIWREKGPYSTDA